MIQQCPAYAIATSQALLHPLSWYGIPWPVAHTYILSPIVRRTGNSNLVGYGFPIASWTWTMLEQSHLWNLLSLFPSNDDLSTDLWIVTYKDTGYEAELGTFQVKANRPVDGNGKTLVANTRSFWSGVSMNFWHMIEA
jgi:hypothetical protein